MDPFESTEDLFGSTVDPVGSSVQSKWIHGGLKWIHVDFANTGRVKKGVCLSVWELSRQGSTRISYWRQRFCAFSYSDMPVGVIFIINIDCLIFVVRIALFLLFVLVA